MNVSQASKIWLDYHRAHSKDNTVRAYKFTIAKFNQSFANLNLSEVSMDNILYFMTQITEGRKPQTKRVQFAHLNAYFNFMKNNFDCDFKNPCDSKILRKLFKSKVIVHWDIIEKDTVDEIIFRTNESRVFFFNTKGRKSSVPLHWTDIGPQDSFVAVSAGRSLYRVVDLLGLVRLIGEIKSANHK